ncbi:hypothetical protein C8A05DRAFT_34695 [Staphylotrichum tortipilum]|uniref:LysM domain-containing protein n=1 Tax=Staphylotrichum tortipilum TaxID=2831512 RepID=A0AAN6MJ84_9PEZI|nr:hypothetical protein C8A05DRAFT_34695 [Staphylotrichum longicolle]
MTGFSWRLLLLAAGGIGLARAQTATTPPAPTFTGSPSSCNKWYVIASGDTCAAVETKFGISHADFIAWNPAVSNDCATNFWLGQAYCIVDGDDCGKVEATFGITHAQFIAWNPVVSSDCQTNFSLGQAYCVGLGQAQSSTTSTGSSTTSAPPVTTPYSTRYLVTSETIIEPTYSTDWPPTKTQAGQPAYCNKWHLVEGGETCSTIVGQYSTPRSSDHSSSAASGSSKTITSQYFDCVQQVNTGGNTWKNESIICPPHYISGHTWNVWFIAKDTARLATYLSDKYYIQLEWTVPRDFHYFPCTPSEVVDCSDYGHMRGFPELPESFEVPNPKEAIGEALTNLRALVPYLEASAREIKLFIFDEDDGDAVPVFMVQSAIDQMKQIYEIGEDIQKKERENLIIMIVTAFLFVLPGVGEALASITGVAMLARVVIIATESGGAAVGAYDLATNPDNLAVGIFSYLLGFVGVRGALKGSWKDVATLRRKMSADDVKNLGDLVKNGLTKVDKVANICRKG